MPRLSTLSRSIEGKVALITGTASGMGRATAYLFADEGAHVVATDIETNGLNETAQAIEGAGGSVLGLPLDVTDGDAIHEVVNATVERFGGLDILVNNAGIALSLPIDDDAYPESWRKSMAVLLDAQMNLIRAALPHLRKAEHPRIVNIASTEGMGATAGNSAYVAAKHGVIGLTRGLAVELGKEGITVNCICPGPIRTGMTKDVPEDAKETYARRRTALRRYGDPEEVAHGTLNFVLPAASFITGATLQVDGGLTVRRA